MSSEVLKTESWLVTRAKAAPEISSLVGDRVFSRTIPYNTKFPYLFINPQAATDRRGPGATRIFVTEHFLIKGVCDVETLDQSLALTEAIETVFDVGAVNEYFQGIYISGIHRITPIVFTEDADNKPFEHTGGIFQCRARRRYDTEAPVHVVLDGGEWT